jgi:hypothetical protein
MSIVIGNRLGVDRVADSWEKGGRQFLVELSLFPAGSGST